MIDGISNLLTSLKEASPQLLLGIATTCGILLFAPERFSSALGLDTLVSQYRPLIGGGFLLSLSVLAAQSLWWSRKFLLDSINNKKLHKLRRAYLSELTADEKAYLLPYIQEGENTMYFSVDDGVVAGLSRKRILYQPTPMGSIVDGFAFNLQSWARRELTQSPELLSGAGPRPPTPRKREDLEW